MKKKDNILVKYPFLTNVGKLLSANTLVQIIAFVLSIFIARLYSQDDFGLLAKFMSIASVFILLASMRLELAIILPKKDNEANALFKLAFVSSLIMSLICFLFLFFCSSFLNSYFDINAVHDWIYIMPIVVFFASIFNLLINYKNREKKYTQLAIGQAIQGISNPFGSLSFFGILNYGLIQSILLANFVSSIYLSFTLKDKKIWSTAASLKQTFKKYYRFPSFNLLHALVNNVSTSLPVLMLSPHFENYLIGLFTMAIGKIFRPINLFSNVIYQVFSKKIVDDLHLNKNVSVQFVKLLFTLIAVAIVPFMLMYFFAPNIFSFVFGTKWYTAGVYLKLLLPWLFMVYLVGSFSFIPNLFQEQKNALFIEIVYLFLRFLALSYGISKLSLTLALTAYAWAGVLVLSFTLAWYYYLVKNKKIQDE